MGTKEQDNVPFLGETLQEQRASFYGCAENIQLSTDTALWEFEQKVFEQITYYIMISGISPFSKTFDRITTECRQGRYSRNHDIVGYLLKNLLFKFPQSSICR